jgi:hypothetical protein
VAILTAVLPELAGQSSDDLLILEADQLHVKIAIHYPVSDTNMPDRDRPATSFFTHIDVSTHSATALPADMSVPGLLLQLVTAQHRQNELLEQLIQQMNAVQRQRATELGQWKQANPELARRCRTAAETLGQIQTRFLETVTDEISDNADCMMEGEFMLNEFVDRFGPRLAHLNGVLQVLSQLSSVPAASDAT